MEQCFATMFEDVTHERLLIIVFSLTDPDLVKQSKFADHEIIMKKVFALEKVHIRGALEEYIALALLGRYILFNECLVQIWSKNILLC